MTRVDSADAAPGAWHVHSVIAEIGQAEVAQEHAAIGMRIRAHAARAFGRKRGQLRSKPALVVEQLFRPVALHPFFENAHVLRVSRISLIGT